MPLRFRGVNFKSSLEGEFHIVSYTGEYLFTVHRTVWQSALFRSWVFNKQRAGRLRYVSVEYALETLEDLHPEVWEECLYWAWKDDPKIPAPAWVVGTYFHHLQTCRFLAGGTKRGNPYGWTFSCVRPELVLLAPEFNSPRYLPREGGVLDSETGEYIDLGSQDPMR